MSLFNIYGYFFHSTSPNEGRENTVPTAGNGIDEVSGRVVAVLPDSSQNEALQRDASRSSSSASIVSVAENEGEKLSEREVVASPSSVQVPARSSALVLTNAEIDLLAEQIMLAETPEDISKYLKRLEGCEEYIIKMVLTKSNGDSCTVGEYFIDKPDLFPFIFPVLLKINPIDFLGFMNSTGENGSSLMDMAKSNYEYTKLVNQKISDLNTDLLKLLYNTWMKKLGF